MCYKITFLKLKKKCAFEVSSFNLDYTLTSKRALGEQLWSIIFAHAQWKTEPSFSISVKCTFVLQSMRQKHRS